MRCLLHGKCQGMRMNLILRSKLQKKRKKIYLDISTGTEAVYTVQTTSRHAETVYICFRILLPLSQLDTQN